MKLKTGILILTLLWNFPALAQQPAWEKISTVSFPSEIQKLYTGAQNKGLLLMSSAQLYDSQDLRPLFALPGKGSLNGLGQTRSGDRIVLSTRGAFRQNSGRKDWEEFFQPSGKSSLNALSFSAAPDDEEILFIGTEAGLFSSLDNGLSWFKENSAANHEKVYAISHHPLRKEFLFVATDKDFYRSDDFGRTFRKTFRFPASKLGEEDVQGADEPGAIEDPPPSPASSVLLAVSAFDPNEIYLSKGTGLFRSKDLGRTWDAVTVSGLGNTPIHNLKISSRDGSVFAANEKGIFQLPKDGSGWKELYEGFSGKPQGTLELASEDRKEILYTSTTHGIFQWTRDPIYHPEIPDGMKTGLPGDRFPDIKKILEREPSILQVQKAAIGYADAKNGKIKKWHASSRLKALVPGISMGKDIDSHNTIDIDRWGTNQSDQYILGPEYESRGEDISLNWDLADLIWSSDQTSIDSRSKLMVEMRNDIVNEVTRLYFERKKQLINLYLMKPADQMEYLDLLLRIDELTGYIDGLTGGYFSRELEKGAVTYR